MYSIASSWPLSVEMVIERFPSWIMIISLLFDYSKTFSAFYRTKSLSHCCAIMCMDRWVSTSSGIIVRYGIFLRQISRKILSSSSYFLLALEMRYCLKMLKLARSWRKLSLLTKAHSQNYIALTVAVLLHPNSSDTSPKKSPDLSDLTYSYYSGSLFSSPVSILLRLLAIKNISDCTL